MKTFLAKLRCRKIFMFVTNWMILESKGKEFSKYSLLKQIKLLVFYCRILCNSEVTKYPTKKVTTLTLHLETVFIVWSLLLTYWWGKFPRKLISYSISSQSRKLCCCTTSYTEVLQLQIVTETHLHEKLISVLQAGTNYLSSQTEEREKKIIMMGKACKIEFLFTGRWTETYCMWAIKL